MIPATKAVAVLLLTSALCGPAAAQRPRHTDLERDDLAGPVKRVAVAVTRAGAPGAPEPVETSTYSRDGWLTERELYLGGKLAARVTYHDDPDGLVRHASSTTPQGIGYGVRVTRLQPLETPASPFVAAADGTYPFTVVRTFDTAGRLIDETTYPGVDAKQGPALSRVTYRYDAQGRLSERSRFYGQSQAVLEKETYGYDEHDHVLEIVHYRQSNSMASKRTFAYEFDEHGNWTKRAGTERLSGIPIVFITTREITYY